MKGVVAIVVAAVLACGLAAATPALDEPKQYEQFCEHQTVEGTGYVEVATAITDKHIALEYTNFMQGDGEFAMDSTHVYSQDASKLERPTPNCTSENGTVPNNLNFYEDTKVQFEVRGAPLYGEKYLNSKGFYGGIDADVREIFNVNTMDKTQKAYFGSTKSSDIAHTIGLDVASAFNGSWGTEATMHKIFYKDIQSRELFSGEFEVGKQIKFHENATEPDFFCPCEGIDC